MSKSLLLLKDAPPEDIKFAIDRTLGRNIKVQIDFSSEDSPMEQIDLLTSANSPVVIDENPEMKPDGKTIRFGIKSLEVNAAKLSKILGN